MRILFAAHHASRVAGTETYIHTVAAALSARGHRIALLAEQPAVAGREPIGAVEHTWCTQDAGEARALAAARGWAPDAVFVHGMSSVRVERALVDVAPAVLFEHSYAGLCISGSRTWQSNGAECRRTLGAGCLVHYFPHRCGGRSPVTMARDYARQRARQRLHQRYRAIVVASRYMAAFFEGNNYRGRVRVLPPPIAPPVATSPRPMGTPLRVVYAGRLESLKGVQLLPEAVCLAYQRLRRPLELCIAGDGPLRPMLERQCGRSSGEGVKIVLPGWQGRSDRDVLLGAADVLAVPSLWPEPFGLSGLEAARFGVPAVAFASGGIAEWLHDGVNGLVAHERSGAALADSIATLLGDGDLYRRLSAGALEAARTASPGIHVSELERLFAEIAA